MNGDIRAQFQSVCDLLALPINDIGIVSRLLPSTHVGLKYSATFADRTFLLIACGRPTASTAVFFLGSSGDEIEMRVVGGETPDLREVCEMLGADDVDTEGFCHSGLAQLLSPLTGFGVDRLLEVTLITAECLGNKGKTIGVIFKFPFSIQLGLHVFDDYFLSLSSNDACDVIVEQAYNTEGVSVVRRQLARDDRPHYAKVDWFDWLKLRDVE